MQKHLVQGRFKGVELDLCIFTTYTFCKNKKHLVRFSNNRHGFIKIQKNHGHST